MSKKARSEGSRVAGLIKANKAGFYIADVELNDETNDVIAAAEVVNKTLGKHKAAFLLISAGNKCLSIVVSVPDNTKKINSKEWLNESVKNISGDRTDFNDTTIVITADTPFKLKDIVRSSGFAYLTKNGCISEDESSEEFVGFDDI